MEYPVTPEEKEKFRKELIDDLEKRLASGDISIAPLLKMAKCDHEWEMVGDSEPLLYCKKCKLFSQP